jgi:hypothetical protein
MSHDFLHVRRSPEEVAREAAANLQAQRVATAVADELNRREQAVAEDVADRQFDDVHRTKLKEKLFDSSMSFSTRFRIEEQLRFDRKR